MANAVEDDVVSKQERRTARACRGTYHNRRFRGYFDDVFRARGHAPNARRFEKRVTVRAARRHGRILCGAEVDAWRDDIAAKERQWEADDAHYWESMQHADEPGLRWPDDYCAAYRGGSAHAFRGNGYIMYTALVNAKVTP